MDPNTPAHEKAAQKATIETVIDVHYWEEGLFTFRTTKPGHYSFTAGQYARLGLEHEGDIIWRAYSMTSAPDADHLEFYGIVVPGGRFTTLLKEIKPADRIWVDKQSFGFMTVDRFTDGEDLWMLSTGTGIGPYISILRDPYVWGKFRQLRLVHCVRHASEFAYRDELLALQQNPPAGVENPGELQVIRTVTREPAQQPDHLEGRITTLLENGALEKAAGITLAEQSSRIMICGNPDMIEDARRILHHRGMRPVRRLIPGQFVTENYW